MPPLPELEEAARALDLHLLRGPDTVLRGDRRQHEDERVHRGEGDVELGRLLFPEAGRLRLEGEVDRKQTREEHHLAAEPHDRADRHHVGALD
jgi:hypothetical protein